MPAISTGKKAPTTGEPSLKTESVDENQTIQIGSNWIGPTTLKIQTETGSIL